MTYSTLAINDTTSLVHELFAAHRHCSQHGQRPPSILLLEPTSLIVDHLHSSPTNFAFCPPKYSKQSKMISRLRSYVTKTGAVCFFFSSIDSFACWLILAGGLGCRNAPRPVDVETTKIGMNVNLDYGSLKDLISTAETSICDEWRVIETCLPGSMTFWTFTGHCVGRLAPVISNVRYVISDGRSHYKYGEHCS